MTYQNTIQHSCKAQSEQKYGGDIEPAPPSREGVENG